MKRMKQWISVVLVLAMALGMVACGQPNANGAAQGDQLTAQTATADPTTGDKTGEGDATQATAAPEATTDPSTTEAEDAKQDNASSESSDEQTQDNKETTNLSNTGDTTTDAEPEQGNNTTVEQDQNDSAQQDKNDEQPDSGDTVVPVGIYNKGIVLVKVKESFKKEDLGTVSYTSAEPLYNGSKWYVITLTDAEKTEEAVTYLTGLGTLAAVDYDYVMATDGDTASADVSGNPDYASQTNLGLHNIPYGWTQNGKHPGGSPDVVIAVIDTGVDYNHLDLRNNIWTNPGEIPDNGLDDDGNGYIDDVYGWDCVNNDSDPTDDNGHGTHVAGIIAAENNKIGGIGVAYNCKVMVLKAGNSSGYFNNSDVAEAIQYAYMHGASVINMSFGGSYISIAVEEALQNAYNSCILVAAAGNDSACNDLLCKACLNRKVSYPAALPYVIGVMSTDANGQSVSSFSNYDHNPYNAIEYEVYAVGEAVKSTWPGNKYAALNGTSMAAPTVSGIAALLRSAFPDREAYSTKFIQSQIVNTGTVNPYNSYTERADEAHSVTNVQEALTKLPTPDVKLYDYYIDDGVAISEKNNGNGVMDAGETVRLYFALHNRGGVASDVNVTIDTDRGQGLVDPNFTFVNTEVHLSDIGTYSVRESGDQYFEIVVSAGCPNDYLVDFNIRYTYKNGMDEKDETVYKDNGNQKALFNVSSGYHLPMVVTEDTVYKNDRLYILSETMLIPAGVTVTFEEGCRIQFYDDREHYNSPQFEVYGTLNLSGTPENMITIRSSERYPGFACIILSHGETNLDYVDAVNLIPMNQVTTSNSILRTDTGSEDNMYKMVSGATALIYGYDIGSLYNTYIEITAFPHRVSATEIVGCFILLHTQHENTISSTGKFTDNILYTKHSGFDMPTGQCDFSGTVSNNMFMSASEDSPKDLHCLSFRQKNSTQNNTFSAGYRKYASQAITEYMNSNGDIQVDVFGSCEDISKQWPHVVSVEMLDADGNPITTVGHEAITVRVTFNRPMAQREDTHLVL